MKKFLCLFMAIWLMFETTVLAEGFTEKEYARYLYAKYDNVLIREDCDPESEVIGELQEREIVYGLEFLVGTDGNNWVLAQTQAGDGYILEDCLVYLIDEITIFPETVQLILTEDTAVRYEPEEESGIYETLEAGTEISALAFYPSIEKGTWASIAISSHLEGFLSVENLCNLDGTKFPNLPEYVKVKVDTKAYDEPNNGANLKTILYKGDILKVEKYLRLTNGYIVASCINRNWEHVGFVAVKNLSKLK